MRLISCTRAVDLVVDARDRRGRDRRRRRTSAITKRPPKARTAERGDPLTSRGSIGSAGTPRVRVATSPLRRSVAGLLGRRRGGGWWRGGGVLGRRRADPLEARAEHEHDVAAADRGVGDERGARHRRRPGAGPSPRRPAGSGSRVARALPPGVVRRRPPLTKPRFDSSWSAFAGRAVDPGAVQHPDPHVARSHRGAAGVPARAVGRRAPAARTSPRSRAKHGVGLGLLHEHAPTGRRPACRGPSHGRVSNCEPGAARRPVP